MISCFDEKLICESLRLDRKMAEAKGVSVNEIKFYNDYDSISKIEPWLRDADEEFQIVLAEKNHDKSCVQYVIWFVTMIIALIIPGNQHYWTEKDTNNVAGMIIITLFLVYMLNEWYNSRSSIEAYKIEAKNRVELWANRRQRMEQQGIKLNEIFALFAHDQLVTATKNVND